MAVGKAINKGAALRGEGGSDIEISMPPLDQETTVSSQPDPWGERKIAPQLQHHENPFNVSPFGVPDEVPQEVIQAMQEQAAPVEEVVEEVEDIVQAVSNPSRPTPQDSFKALRERTEKAERERDMFAQMVEKQYKQQPVQQQSEPEENVDFNIDDDALVEGKYVKQMAKELKSIKSQIKNYQNQTHEVAVEAKIKAVYPDFERVVSKENVEQLNEMYPEIAKTLRDTSDIYSKASSAYTVIKKFGIYKDEQQVAQTMSYENDRIKAIQNSQKPRPLASVSPQQGDSPLSKANAFANGLTKDLKAQMLAEMNAARKAM